ncbi:hypothetical protein T09_9070 [Trichinella sp. T9]|nr:hypothetical protein T09_9070 [Trichinella sp. T9]
MTVKSLCWYLGMRPCALYLEQAQSCAFQECRKLLCMALRTQTSTSEQFAVLRPIDLAVVQIPWEIIYPQQRHLETKASFPGLRRDPLYCEKSNQYRVST